MSEAILTKEQLTSYIERCIGDLKKGNCQQLTEFASLLQTLAMVTDSPIFFAVPQSIGSYASELSQFKTLVAFPILGKADRENCKQCIDKATSEGVKGLQILKKELCNSTKTNYDTLVKAIAIFSKHGFLMYGLRTQFTALPKRQAFQED